MIVLWAKNNGVVHGECPGSGSRGSCVRGQWRRVGVVGLENRIVVESRVSSSQRKVGWGSRGTVGLVGIRGRGRVRFRGGGRFWGLDCRGGSGWGGIGG